MEKIQVLIADPDRQSVDTMVEALSDTNYLIETVHTGEETLGKCESLEIGICVVEAKFPDMDYCDLCSRIRERYFGIPIQIIVVGNAERTGTIIQSIDDGADDFIQKPIDRQEFLARVKAAEIRLYNQKGLVKEREFFKQAVKEEEELSSRILNQNLFLKRAYQDMIGVNKELEKTNRQLEKIAKYDYLSGLLSRMNLFSILDMEIDRAMRTKVPLSGIMLDIDNFKMVNDNYGHQAGDSVIRDIGRRLSNELRKYDHAGRYGGEEFFIVLPNTDKHQAAVIGERFRENLENHPVRYDEIFIPITASLGIAQLRAGENRESWIRRADKAMYMAKQTGRNRVIAD